MKLMRLTWAGETLLLIHGLLWAGCEPAPGPRTDSQTNWLRGCGSSSECDGLECLCGICTRACEDAQGCGSLQGAECLSAAEKGSVAACGGETPSAPGLCLPRCDGSSCAEGEMCVAGACTPVPSPSARVTVDVSDEHEVLSGFGATLAYIEDAILMHPKKEDLYAAMFADLGLDVLRLQNRYGYTDGDNLDSVSALVNAASDSLGRTPTIVLTSWSPPGSLKASGATLCQGDAETCTLVRNTDGEFDYAGFASHWRESLEAYAQAGVVPDFIGIQNNPDYVPSAASPGEACKFAATEGRSTTYVDGLAVEATYPGFDQAFAAVVDEIAGMDSPPKVIAPETSSVYGVAEYVPRLNIEDVDALGHHLYGIDPNAIDTGALEALRRLGQEYDRPLFQTEMGSDGHGTAVLIHSAMTVEGASAYLQSVLVKPESLDPGTDPLIALSATDYTLDDPYHAMRHYSRFTDPGWLRVGATSDSEGVLASAWLSPDGDALTVVLVNPVSEDAEVAIELEGLGVEDSSELTSRVIRTAFDGVERSAELGSLSTEGVLRIPGRAMVTVAFAR